MRSIPRGFARSQGPAGRSGRARFNTLLLAAIAAAWLAGGNAGAWAQKAYDGGKPGAGNSSKAKSKAMGHYRAKLEVKDDAEWNIIQERIQNVLQAEHELQSVLVVAQHKSHSSGSKSASHGRPQDADSETEVRALQELVKAKATAQEIRSRLARVREIIRAKQDKLAAAREDLRAVLSARQEAVAVLGGLLR